VKQRESKEIKKNHYVEVINSKKVIHPSELGFKRVRFDYIKELADERRIGRKKYTKWYTLLFKLGCNNLADEKFYHDTNRNKNESANYEKIELLDSKIIDLSIGKKIIELIRIPSVEEIGKEIEKDPQNPDIHAIIYKRWARISKVKDYIDKILKELYDGSHRIDEGLERRAWFYAINRSIWEGMPSYDTIIKKIKDNPVTDISDIEDSLLRELVCLCKREYVDFIKKRDVLLT
jgi:hypothetical protein